MKHATVCLDNEWQWLIIRTNYRYKNKLCLIVESRPHIQAHLVFADTQSPNKKPKELEFCQRSIKTTG
jgi:hypothetical protein